MRPPRGERGSNSFVIDEQTADLVAVVANGIVLLIADKFKALVICFDLVFCAYLFLCFLILINLYIYNTFGYCLLRDFHSSQLMVTTNTGLLGV